MATVIDVISQLASNQLRGAVNTFRRDYQIAPILLVGGIAAQMPNGHTTILALTEGDADVNFANESEYFAHFRPLPGATLYDFTPSEYPYASLNMAANAMLQNALKISMRMSCPVRTETNPYPSIQAKITRIQQQLTQHALLGGTFTVATPGLIYADCLLLSLRDVTPAGSNKVQEEFQWDFVQPLVTQQAATQSFNSLYAKLASNLPAGNPPKNSGTTTSIGSAPNNQPT